MVVTTVSIRLALKQICEMTCGTSPSVIPVVALGDTMDRFFATSIPVEFRGQVYNYLVEQLALSISTEDDPLLLSQKQAEELVEQILKPAVTAA